MPMQYFTPDDFTPSERTLYLIRQLAYNYKVCKNSDNQNIVACLN